MSEMRNGHFSPPAFNAPNGELCKTDHNVVRVVLFLALRGQSDAPSRARKKVVFQTTNSEYKNSNPHD